MCRSLIVLGTLLAGLAFLPALPPAVASCAAPYLEAPRVLGTGGAEHVTGRAFVDGCQDTGSCGIGCQSCDYGPPEVPLLDVGLVLEQDGRLWHLGDADAGTAAEDRLGVVTWRFELPDGVRRGVARLVTEHSRGIRVRIR